MKIDSGITRRQLLRTVAGSAGSIALGVNPGRAGAQECAPCPTMTVFNLETTWDEPRGPNQKTRLVSRASRRAAQHRYALNAQDAVDMNLHLCSWAPSREIVVCETEFASLWDELSYMWDNPWLGRPVQVFDIRHVLGIPNGETRLAHALLRSSSGNENCPAPVTVDTLPFTGIAAVGTAATGAGLLLGGMVMLRASRAGLRGRGRPKSTSDAAENEAQSGHDTNGTV